MSKKTVKPKKSLFTNISNFVLIKQEKKKVTFKEKRAKLPEDIEGINEAKKIVKSKKKGENKNSIEKKPTAIIRPIKSKPEKNLKELSQDQKPSALLISKKTVKPKKSLFADISNFVLRKKNEVPVLKKTMSHIRPTKPELKPSKLQDAPNNGLAELNQKGNKTPMSLIIPTKLKMKPSKLKKKTNNGIVELNKKENIIPIVKIQTSMSPAKPKLKPTKPPSGPINDIVELNKKDNKIPLSLTISTKPKVKPSKYQNEPNNGLVELNKKQNRLPTAKISMSHSGRKLRSAKSKESNQKGKEKKEFTTSHTQRNIVETCSCMTRVRKSKRKRKDNKNPEYEYPIVAKRCRK